MLWQTVVDFAYHFQAQIMLGASALVIALLASVFYLIRKVGKLSKTSLQAVDGQMGQLLRQELNKCAKDLSAASDRIEGLQRHNKELKAQQEQCMQRIGFVRFDAFDDVGGEQSFALALLNADNNGVVISNLFSRVDSRVYAKRINGGRSEHTLSEEEREAVEQASKV
ncbi:MAG: DUF4446 family protein [Armatimonadota bacterium]|nr:DUF4446 family protein [Armatimonadota bacterium]